MAGLPRPHRTSARSPSRSPRPDTCAAPTAAWTATTTRSRRTSRPCARDPTATVHTAPARLAAGCAARRRADAGPLTLVPCDNLPGNGAVAARVVRDLAELVDPALADWIDRSVSCVTTVVDRITPRTTPDDRRAVAEATGVDDCCPVGTEPFHEWVLSGAFPAGRPQWDKAGATLADDIDPYEDRKLWLLNGAHSLLAYAGSARGHQTVAEAVADDTCREWMQQWWTEASRHIDLPADVLDNYRAALRRPLRQPPHAPPARPDRRRRLPEAPGPDPARPARRTCRRTDARRRHARSGGVDLPPARSRGRGRGRRRRRACRPDGAARGRPAARRGPPSAGQPRPLAWEPTTTW